MPTVEENAATDAGVNLTDMVHEDCAARGLPQVVVCEKSLELPPVIARLEILRVPNPELVRVAVRAALVVPTGVLGKASVAGVTARGHNFATKASLFPLSVC